MAKMVADSNGMGPELVKALIKARKEFKTLVKNKVNPYFKSKYADLAALHDAVDEPLAKFGFTVVQPMGFDEKDHHVIKTVLAHESGQSITSCYPLPGGVKPQELAAAVSYGRRVSLAALLGIPAEDDDDGEATEGRQSAPQDTKPKPQPERKPDPKKDVSWRGTVSAVENLKPNLWKITGGDTSTFATSVPEVKAIAEAASKSLSMVEITYRLNNVGSKIVESLKEIKQ